MLQKWSENWQLRFHLDKCEVLRVTHARDHTSYPYKLSGCTLQSVTETVDLGVSLTSNLSWNTQTQKVVNKANEIVGFLKRNVGPLNKEDFARLHKALVIPNGLNCNDYFESNCYGKTRSNHSFKLRQPLARVNCFLHSFFVRIIKQWNALPKEIVHEQDFSIFRK